MHGFQGDFWMREQIVFKAQDVQSGHLVLVLTYRFFLSPKVEMAGIEPASERIDPQISTSLSGRECHPMGHDRQGIPLGHPLRPESLSFARLAASAVRHSGFLAPGSTSG